MTLRGCGSALITPFDANGAVDVPALETHVRRQVASGIGLLVPCGTTGEASTLSEEETLLVVSRTCAATGGKAQVFAGCTHNSTQVALERARRLAAIPGLSGILTANPYYNKPSQEGQYRHFRAIAEAARIPVMLYNIPGRTGANLEPATVARLAEIDNIVAVKESSGNLVQIAELMHAVPAGFAVFAGDDALALPTLALGAVGLISVASNAIPDAMVELVECALGGDWARARTLNRRYFALLQAHFWEPSPAPVKAVLALLGQGTENLRLPMVAVTEDTRQRLRTVLTGLGLGARADGMERTATQKSSTA